MCAFKGRGRILLLHPTDMKPSPARFVVYRTRLSRSEGGAMDTGGNMYGMSSLIGIQFLRRILRTLHPAISLVSNRIVICWVSSTVTDAAKSKSRLDDMMQTRRGSRPDGVL